MPAQSSVFPAFIRAEYDPSGGGFAQFEQSAAAASDRVRRQFETDFNEIKRLSSQALSQPRGKGGSLDLGVQQYRDAEVAAKAHATALREIATAAERAAIANGDTSEETRRYVQAARAAAVEAEQGARAATQQATAMDRLQAELNQSASATQAVITGQRGMNNEMIRGANSARANKFAYVQLGQQLQDVAIQAQAGINPFVILIQQGSQAAFAMSAFRGAVGRVATFLSGPWGAAVFIAVAAVGSLITKMGEGEKATKDLELASSGLADAQSVLGEMFDLTTGALERQNEMLRLNVRLMAIKLQTEAEEERASARKAFGDVGERTAGGRLAAFGSGFVRGGVPEVLRRQEELRQNAIKQETIYQDLLANRITIEEAATRAAETNMKGLSTDRTEFLGALRDTISAAYKDDVARRALESLESGRLDPAFRREGRNRKPRDNSSKIDSLEEFGRDAANRIANLVSPFEGQPKLIQQQAKALRSLADVEDDIVRKNQELVKLRGRGLDDYEALLASVKEARDVIDKAPALPFTQTLDALDREARVGKLIAEGREEEAELLQVKLRLMEQLGVETEAELAEILKKAGVEGDINATLEERLGLLRDQARATADLQRQQQMYLNALEDVRSNIESALADLFEGRIGGLGDMIKDLRSTAGRLNAQVITEKMFGGIFREMEDWITGRDQVKAANEDYVKVTDLASQAVGQFATSVENAAARISGTGTDAGTPIADAVQTVVVTGQRLPSQSPEQFFDRLFTKIFTSVFGEKVGSVIGDHVADALEGSAYGQMAGGLILGSRGNQTGSAIGGAIGNVAGKALEKSASKIFGETLGSIAGPIGSVVGGILGGLTGGLFSSSKRGSTTVGVDADGRLMIANTRGNSRNSRQASIGGAESINATMERIVDALGGRLVPGRGSVSIGVRDGNYRVDPTGRGKTKLSSGAIDFGDDAEAAVRAAVLDLIKDGVIDGLRASTQRLLKSAKDLDSGLEKALRFESVFARLKEIKNPVAAALEALDKEFANLRRVFQEAGASAAEFAQLEELYTLERARAVKEASEAMTGALRDLLDDLTVNNDALSLRDRLASARAVYDPLAADLKAGKTVDYDAFADAARTVEDIMRQINGSQDGYFVFLDELTGLTREALARQQALIDGATAPAAGETPAANDNAPVVDAIDRLGDTLGGVLNGHFGALNRNMGTLIDLMNPASFPLLEPMPRGNF